MSGGRLRRPPVYRLSICMCMHFYIYTYLCVYMLIYIYIRRSFGVLDHSNQFSNTYNNDKCNKLNL